MAAHLAALPPARGHSRAELHFPPLQLRTKEADLRLPSLSSSCCRLGEALCYQGQRTEPLKLQFECKALLQGALTSTQPHCRNNSINSVHLPKIYICGSLLTSCQLLRIVSKGPRVHPIASMAAEGGELSPMEGIRRTTEFWLRASSIYLGYKATQVKALALQAGGWPAERVEKEVWGDQHEHAARQMYSLCVDLRGFYLKVRQRREAIPLQGGGWTPCSVPVPWPCAMHYYVLGSKPFLAHVSPLAMRRLVNFWVPEGTLCRSRCAVNCPCCTTRCPQCQLTGRVTS